MKIVSIIQARMGSTRLPGKVLKSISNKTVLEHVVYRILQARGIDEVIVATSILSQDDVLEKEANRLNVKCYRGSELDVLGRYFDAASYYQADVIIRITSDCPLLAPELLTDMLDCFLFRLRSESKIDYLGNNLVRTYPRGLDIEIFTMQALQQANAHASLDYQREHVTPFIYQNPEKFSLLNYQNNNDLSHHRWTLDTVEDLEFISAIYNEIYTQEKCFTTNDILELLYQKPWLVDINKLVKQKELIGSKEDVK